MKKSFTLRAVIGGMRAASRRFPLSFLCALTIAGTGLMLVHQVGDSAGLAKILVTLVFGFLLFGSIDLICEQSKWSIKVRSVLSLVGFGLLAGYYAYLPADLSVTESSVILRSVLWGVCLVFLISLAPYLRKGDGNVSGKIWYFNACLVVSIVLTGIWSALAQGGLSIAISAVDHLFNAGITDRVYQDIAVVLLGFFGPTFLLSRVPNDFEHVIEPERYPKEPRLLLQYVFVPLVSLYFLILYAYVIRILVSREWPVGTLAYMILGFSVLGVLVYVCLYPLRSSIAWIRKAGDMYYMVLIPQIGMLFWALWFRISQYGITENRYYVLVAGLLLLALSAYFLVSKKKDLRVIPVCLFLIALVSSFGPWGALAVSERSQQNRLEDLLRKNKILIDGEIRKVNTEDISFNDKKEIGAITSYLVDTHGKHGFIKFFGGEVVSGLDANRENQKRQIMGKFGLRYVESFVSGQQRFHYGSGANASAVVIARFDYAIPGQGLSSDQTIGNAHYQFRVNAEKNTFEISEGGTIIAEKGLNAFLDALSQSDVAGVSKDPMIIAFENDAIAFEYHIERIGGELAETGYRVDLIKGLLLFTVK